jgi:hypothetical protein
MRNQGLIFIGVAVILIGLVLLFGSLFRIDLGVWCWPAGFILLGTWLLLRPWLVKPGAPLQIQVFGPVRREGAWSVTGEDIWLLVGDVRLDLTQTEIPPGETAIRVFAFVADVRLRAPEGVGVSVASTAFLNVARLSGRKREAFFTPVRLSSEDYETAEKKIRLETTCFIADIKAKQE